LNARVIDLRSDSAYAAGHIPTAEHMSLSQLRRARFRRNETIMLYSDRGDETAQAWVFLRASGLAHVYALSGGAEEWADRRKWRGC
jgi:rhodanese-related sulfurtransferase